MMQPKRPTLITTISVFLYLPETHQIHYLNMRKSLIPNSLSDFHQSKGLARVRAQVVLEDKVK